MSTNYTEIRVAVDRLNDCEDALGKANEALGDAWNEFGRILRKLRESRNMSLRDVAKKLGISAPYLSDVELGRRRMTDDRVESCLNLFAPEWNAIREKIVMNSIAPSRGTIGVKKCEGCRSPATTADFEGVPLCDECAADLAASVRGANKKAET
jgi:hypothetical protein